MIVVGPMRPSERAFVATSWLRSYEHAELHHLSRGAYWRHFGALVDSLLDAGRVTVARNSEDETQALGFVCASGDDALHYVYVKWLMRDRPGQAPLYVGARLLGESGVDLRRLRCSFTTTAWLKYAAKHGMEFEPDRQLVTVTRASARRAPREEKAA